MPEQTITISLAQIDIHLGDRDANLAQAHRLVEEAARRRSHLILLPELWTTGYDLERAEQLAEPCPGGPTATTLSAWARRYGLWIAGSYLIRGEAGPFNGAPLFGPQGQVLGPYGKIHRFGLMQEDRWLQAGDEPGLYSLPWGDTGLAICYDLRFPELFRAYAVAGARLILLPSEWPHPRLHHWRTLLQARAIENQCFIAAVNRVGSDRANRFCGHSMLVDPWGEIVVEAGEQPLLLTAEIDLAQADEIRSRIPVFADRRPACYRGLA
ncbi:MAG: carbon-nitrogen family hydrolase [Caldilineae bacterium]|nr:MAG: carbon-nitrogen family hydrolase [Caldilineae bacterium]